MPHFRYYLLALLILVISLLLPYLPVFSILLKTLDLGIYDNILQAYNTFTHDENEGVYDQICIIDIDEKSIKDLGQFSSWPSIFFADLVNILAEDKPLAIAFDVFFTETDSIKGFARQRMAARFDKLGPNPEHILDAFSTDNNFTEAMKNAGNVYLAMFNSDYPSYTGALPDKLIAWNIQPKYYLNLQYPVPPIAEFTKAAKGIGFGNITPDVSGKIHDYPLFFQYNGKMYVNFSMQLCLDLLGIDKIEVNRNCKLISGKETVSELPLSPEGLFYFKYYGPGHSFRYISFSDVLFHRIPKGYFQDRIILVGTSAYGLKDNKITPLDRSYPGVELHSTFMRNLLEEDYIHWINNWWLLGINIVVLVCLAFIIPRSKPLFSIGLFLFISLLSLPAVYILYAKASYTYTYSTLLIPWVFGFLAMFFTQAHEQGKEKRKIRDAFEHYVSPEVIGQMMKEPEKLKAGGEKKYISVLFADVRNFTTLCEQLTPTEITSFMHKYFNLATQIIIEQRGTLDKYVGDAILALFGAPVTYAGFEINAVQSALSICEISSVLQEEYQNHPILYNFQIGIGIATGEIIVGNIGSDRIFNYTGIGDKMNFGSRLEGLNKFYQTSIIIDDFTFQAVKNNFFCRHLDRVKVKGKNESCDIYEVIDTSANMQNKPDIAQIFHKYESALNLLITKHQREAKALFEEVLMLMPTDEPTKIMLKRFDIINWDIWDGAWQFESK